MTFDSIESMNADELLVKRKRGKKKFLLGLAFVCAVCFTIGLLIGYFSGRPSDDEDGGGAAPSTGGESFDFAKFIVANIDKDRIRETLRQYSSEPHLAGTALDGALALKIQQEWTQNGLDEVHLASYNILLSFPNTSNPNVIQIFNKTNNSIAFESHKYEVPLPPHLNNSGVVPPFNGFSPPGYASGQLVYVNYGRIEDFIFLKNNLSINCTGKIVIARYGKIYRGDKLKNAHQFGATALMLYSDPSDVNLGMDNNTYPSSWWLPPSGIQRGTVADDGDPMTPLYPSTDYAHRLSDDELDLVLPPIPCQPIGYNDAEIILRHIGGDAAPESWQGGLNFTYHLGPDLADNHTDLEFRVKVNNYREVRPVHNVIGYIRGSEEPDRYILLGNHHDAWVFGAVDPLSGSAAVTEITRVFGKMLKEGHRPRRTVVFCSWDAEEYGLMGSVEWVEDNLKVLHQRGVAYLNMDYAADSNYTLSVGTSPLLQDMLYASAKKVPSPDRSGGETLFDLWKARPVSADASTTDPVVTYSLGSGSDMAAFYQRAGVPSVDLWMTYDQMALNLLAYPLYHSSYETFFAYDTYIDPGFSATLAVTRFMAVAASDLANADLLPLKVQRYSAAVSSFHDTLLDKFSNSWREKQVNIDAFSSAVGNFTEATKAFQDSLDADRDTVIQNPLKLRQINDRLIQLERAFLDPEGLPGRPTQKHVMFAPSQFDAYVDNSFPGITDTMSQISQGQDLWEQLKQQVFVATYIIQSAASTLDDIGL